MTQLDLYLSCCDGNPCSRMQTTYHTMFHIAVLFQMNHHSSEPHSFEMAISWVSKRRGAFEGNKTIWTFPPLSFRRTKIRKSFLPFLCILFNRWRSLDQNVQSTIILTLSWKLFFTVVLLSWETSIGDLWLDKTRTIWPQQCIKRWTMRIYNSKFHGMIRFFFVFAG